MKMMGLSRVLPQRLRWYIKSKLGLGRALLHSELNNINFSVGSRYILDVGANRGGFASDILLRAPLAEVHCFEPNTKVFPLLKEKCKKLGLFRNKPRAIANAIALGSSCGDEELIITEFHPASSFLPVSEACVKGWPNVDFTEKEKITVSVTTLEKYAEEQCLGEVKLLKIDVQGFEMEVLKGAGTLLESIEYILLEVQFMPLYIGAPEWTELVKYLYEHGFSPENMGGFCLDSSGKLLQADILFKNTKFI